MNTPTVIKTEKNPVVSPAAAKKRAFLSKAMKKAHAEYKKQSDGMPDNPFNKVRV